MPFDSRSRSARETQEAKDWLKANDPALSKEDRIVPDRKRDKQRTRCKTLVPGQRGKGAPHDRPYNGRYPREIAAKRQLETVKAFVERHKDTKETECICVPVAVKGRMASVVFCGQQIPASRYACLLKHGAPTSDGMVARHLCGNGHLNCINPNHVAWGTPGDNFADMFKHKALGEGATTEDKIKAVE